MPQRTRDVIRELAGASQIHDRRNQLFFTLRKNVILRSEPQYLRGFYAVRDSYNWQTYYINESGLHILSAIAKGLSLEEIIATCTPCGSEPANTEVDSILEFIAGFITKDIIKIHTSPQHSPDVLIPLGLPQVDRTKVTPMRFPTHVDLLMTSGCNLRCKHCFIPHTPTPLLKELTTEEIKQLLLQLDQLGVFVVRISGGEPLTRPDFLQIIQFTRKLKSGLRVLTNGTLVTEEHVKEFSHISTQKNWGFVVNISLDGATAQSHEWLRGVSGCFQKTVEALNNLNEAGVRCTVETILHKCNINEIEDIIQLCITLGVKGLSMHPADNTGKAACHPESLLQDRDVIDLLPLMCDLQQHYEDTIEIEFDMRHYSQFVKTLVESHRPDNMLTLPRNTCEAGMYSMSIGPSGKVYPCNYAVGYEYFEIGDIRRQQILDIWHSKRWNVFRGGWQLESLSTCRKCPRFKGCPILYCRVYPTITLGDFFGPMPECVKYVAEIQGGQ